ncbi:hypothetical protein PFICI_05139 [Pestalotiopsis fici W106-1]|uniref:Cut9-interacting protein scn1 n=1 Tax=Pestalotiopsis fici (strain W106-1 / CGMCC3.15140) TaxID=1229662 RepID=W3XB11_PESFW|nr:uncharacterized protein PFICI_05139 [Pestalotiopsis fici W106-1]ETS83263.1 hypothetical protein PFICI_05139 [Pestalotiopsis fici W106-1]
MCQQHGDTSQQQPRAADAYGSSRSDETIPKDPFPWDVGVFDAHCHPTDTMALVSSIPDMKARALTVMSTRSQDQNLVHDLALEQGVEAPGAIFSTEDMSSHHRRVIPSFGWHPWFSYQIYDDKASEPTYDGTAEGKAAHYDKILSPAPSSQSKAFSSGLQDPVALSKFISETRARLQEHPHALVGEIGLDKAFRIPESWTVVGDGGRDETLTPGGREGRRLSPHRVNIAHQTSILKAQLQLAGELNRAVSVHGVQVHGGVYNAISDCWKGYEKEVLSRREQRKIAPHAHDLEDDSSSDSNAQPDVKPSGIRKGNTAGKPFPPRICLHSYSGPVNIMNQYLHKTVPSKVFFSFSTAINFDPEGGEKNQKTEEAIRACPDNRVLVESDLHVAGDSMDGALESICRKVCELKGWPLREGVEQLARNYREFVFDD